jgi:hypothetical protein
LSLVVVAIFDDVYEGEIATALLRSAGIPAFLMGHWLAKYDGLQQRVWGGVRLAVPASCRDDADEIISTARSGAYAPDEPSDLPEPSPGNGWAAFALLDILLNMGTLGWALSGLRRRRTAVMWIGFWLIAAATPLLLYAYFSFDPFWPLTRWFY